MSVTGSAKKNSRSSAANSKKTVVRQSWAVCVDNSSYEVSLERGKIYRVLPDRQAAADGLIRVIDESEEDYLFPSNRFMPIQVSSGLAQALVGKRRNGKTGNSNPRTVRSAKT